MFILVEDFLIIEVNQIASHTDTQYRKKYLYLDTCKYIFVLAHPWRAAKLERFCKTHV